MSNMACRSCGLGPSKRVVKRPQVETVTTRNKPIKGLVTSNKQKTEIPTRSPAKTFTNVGDP